MQKPQQLKNWIPQDPTLTDWVEYINDDNLKLAIPIGPRFQANVPEWSGPPQKNSHVGEIEHSTSRWLGTRIWPIHDKTLPGTTKVPVMGKGRPNFCLCASPGSRECVKRHVALKRTLLQSELGPIYWRWRFNEMGDEVSKLWTSEEQKRFESLVKMNHTSQFKSFLKPALECLPCQSRETIVNYYFNVHIPSRMSRQTRLGCTNIDTDDEAEEASNPNGSHKRYRAHNASSYSSKVVKFNFLNGCR